MKKWTSKWREKLGILLLTGAFLFLLTPASAEAAYSDNLIPVLTGPSAQLSASSEYPGRPAWLALDDDPTSFWATASGQYTGWLQYEFPESKVITKFSFSSIESADVPGYTHLYFGTVLDAILEGYDQETNNWVEVGSAGISNHPYDEITRYDIEVNNQKEYKKYRVRFNGWDQWSQVAIFDLEMYETLPAELTFSDSASSSVQTKEFSFLTPKRVSKVQFNISNTSSLPASTKVEGYNETSSQWENITYTGSVVLGNNELTLTGTSAYKKYRINFFYNDTSTINFSGLTVYGRD